jgi:ubiquinone/menaquinone biosynthesis C-methylase UbiE
MDVYQEMAEHYDLIYGDQMDVEFYLREAKNARGPVLEVSCGTGRILLKLLQEGIDIAGLDLSENMLAVLKSKAKQLGLEPDVHLANMVDFKIGRTFNLIIVPYRSFLHLATETERKQALQTFMDHLNKGGRLILHTYNPSKDDLEMIGDYHHFDQVEFAEGGKKYTTDWYLHYEPNKRAGNYKVSLTMEDGKKLEYSMTIYFLKIKEMKELLQRAGYKNIRYYCGFDYSPFDEDCGEVVWIVER